MYCNNDIVDTNKLAYINAEENDICGFEKKIIENGNKISLPRQLGVCFPFEMPTFDDKEDGEYGDDPKGLGGCFMLFTIGFMIQKLNSLDFLAKEYLMKKYDVKATFFIVGNKVAQNSELVKRMLDEGHVLGNHSFSHRALSEFDIPDYSELDKAQNAIFDVTGIKPALFRPPYGRKTPWEIAHIKNRGLTVITWSISANDPAMPAPEVIENRIVSNAFDGGIILLHDGDGVKNTADRSNTVASLPAIGRAFGGRDHSTVLHAYKQVAAKIKRDQNLAALVEEIARQMRAGKSC
jgi:hypothetical protein